MAACFSSDDTPAPQTEQSTTPDDPDNPSSNPYKSLVAYFPHSPARQSRSQTKYEFTGADIYRIEAADPYAKIHTIDSAK